MSDSQFVSLASFIVLFLCGAFSFYKGARMLRQSIPHKEQIVWYKRFNLTRGIYLLLLGSGLMIIESTNFTGVAILQGAVSQCIMLGMAILMVLFGILSLRYKPQT